MSVRAQRIFSAVLATTLAAATISVAQDRPAPPGRVANPLHDAMEDIGKIFKQLRPQIADASKNESSLKLLEDLQRHTLAAKSMIPKGAATRPADHQPKYLLTYRIDMNHMLRLQLELEEHLLDGDNSRAAETLQAIVDAMEEAHKEFKPPKRKPAQ